MTGLGQTPAAAPLLVIVDDVTLGCGGAPLGARGIAAAGHAVTVPGARPAVGP